MQIHGLHQALTTQPTNRPNTTSPTGPVESPPAVNAASSDQLDLSSEAQEISKSQVTSPTTSSEIRTEKVAELRQAIADGRYETPERMSAALDKMLDTFA